MKCCVKMSPKVWLQLAGIGWEQLAWEAAHSRAHQSKSEWENTLGFRVPRKPFKNLNCLNLEKIVHFWGHFYASFQKIFCFTQIVTSASITTACQCHFLSYTKMKEKIDQRSSGPCPMTTYYLIYLTALLQRIYIVHKVFILSI